VPISHQAARSCDIDRRGSLARLSGLDGSALPGRVRGPSRDRDTQR